MPSWDHPRPLHESPPVTETDKADNKIAPRRKAAAPAAPGKTSRGPGRLSADEMAKLNDRLLDAALKLFSEHGYAGTSMERIAKEAGASTKTIYSRYANKNAVLDAVVARFAAIPFAQPAAQVDPAIADPRAFLIGFFTPVVGMISRGAVGLVRLAFAEGHRFPELAHGYLSVINTGLPLIGGALSVWQQQGKLPLLGDVERSVTLMVSMVTDRPRIRAVLGVPMNDVEIETYIKFAVEMFLKGCGYTWPGMERGG